MTRISSEAYLFETQLKKLSMLKVQKKSISDDDFFNHVSTTYPGRDLVFKISKIIQNFDHKYISGHVLACTQNRHLNYNSTHCELPPWPCVPQALQMIKSVCMLNKLFPEKEKKFFRRQAWQVKVRSYPKITLSCAFYLSPQVCKAFVKFRNFFFSSFFPPLSIEWQKLEKSDKESFILNMINTEKNNLFLNFIKISRSGLRTLEKQWGGFF